MNIYSQIKSILIKELEISESSVQLSSSFIDDLNMDPDDLAEFFTTVEDQFTKPGKKIEIPEKDFDDILTIQNLIDYLIESGVDE